MLDLWTWSDLDRDREWEARLAAADSNPRASLDLRRAIRRGEPYGDEAFVSELEQRFGRRLRPGKPRLARAAAV